MTAPDCPYPNNCPVPDPASLDLRRLRSVVWPAGTVLWRGHPRVHPADELVPEEGDSRFAPLPDAAHSYVSTSQTAGLFESALHDASGPVPRIRPPTLERWALSEVTTTVDVRLVDLRDEQLDRLGLDRRQLVNTTAAHYRCTRMWGLWLHARQVGGQTTHGLVWHSRQADLHAREGRSQLLTDLLVHRSVEVAVIYAPPAPEGALAAAGRPLPLDTGDGHQLVVEVASLLGIPIL